MQVSVFLCPSDSRLLKQPITNYMASVGGPFQLGGYSGAFVPLNAWGVRNNTGAVVPQNYPLSQNSGTIGFSGITDGTSNTALWSEAASGSNIPVIAGTGKLSELRTFFAAGTQSNWNNVVIGAPNAVTQFLAQCVSLAPGTVGNSTTPRGANWQVTMPYYANYGMYNHVGGPNSRQCSNIVVPSTVGGGPGLDVYGTSPPTSFHQGGVNVAMCDGSVRFIRDQINLYTWWAIGTRAGNEPINANSF
jgi:prepilin-type processing-associated H-X9-DG protein